MPAPRRRPRDLPERIEARRASVPPITYPAELPISAWAEDIREAIAANQVVIVAGETGSGKSTQLPKICLDAGLGVRGMVGHTQPRRIAARAVAERVAEELRTTVGGLVGYTVRFNDRVTDATLVRVMTDGILLNELQRDRLLRGYDAIIVDEAHERSLNIDFLLGYLKQILPQRPDLKVIVTSATIDTARFAGHFDGAPVIEVSGRGYPVEVRYRPFEDDQAQAICAAVEELWTEGPGDVLVFCSGEREIRDAADALTELNLPETDLLPLFARLSAAEQHRVFEPHAGRRVVLATNVAETSLTVPGIRYVVDPGTARISRYSRGTKVQRLPIEPISQASANQRAGRCGRVAPGVCIRLYAEDDFESRPAFTEPEILRTNLASVVLQMTALGLGDIEQFPFVEPPDRRNIADGKALLHELGAVDSAPTHAGGRGARQQAELTQLGRRLARLPLDPRLGRMVLEGVRRGCGHEAIVIASVLSIQDPRERPEAARKEAAAAHARFADADSDFTGFLNLWNHIQDQQRKLSSSKFRKLCRAEFLNYLRVREWQDIHGQVREAVRQLGLSVNKKPADTVRLHRALLSGLLSNLGYREGGPRSDYRGARGARFALSPGSALFGKPPKWVVAAEIVETTRPWAHVAARIQPAWAEEHAGHLLKDSYGDPEWDDTRASAVAPLTRTLYGLPIITGRRIDFGRVDAGTAREMFVTHALVQGRWRTSHEFVRTNRRLLDELGELESRARRPLLPPEDRLFDFYEQRVPVGVTSGAEFDAWWEEEGRSSPGLLVLTREVLAADGAPGDYPDEWRQSDLRLKLSYLFEPGAGRDGITVHIPLAVLNQVAPGGFDWLVPGYRSELVLAMIRSLPKDLRRRFVPPQEHVDRFLAAHGPQDGPLADVLGGALDVPPESFRQETLPEHLRVTYVVERDGRGDGVVAEGKDLHALQRRLSRQMRERVASAAEGLERAGITAWTIGTLPRTVEAQERGRTVRAYPALTDERDSVAIRMFASEAKQLQAHRAGLRRLLVLTACPPVRVLDPLVPRESKLGLARQAGALDDCLLAVADSFLDRDGLVWDEQTFAALHDQARSEFTDRAVEALTAAGRVLVAAGRVDERIAVRGLPPDLVDDISEQVRRLAPPGFAVAAGTGRLPDLLRYLRAAEYRLDRFRENPVRDEANMGIVRTLSGEFGRALERVPDEARNEPAVAAVKWMLEELRVSLFAQQLGTSGKVSEQRVLRAIDALAAAPRA